MPDENGKDINPGQPEDVRAIMDEIASLTRDTCGSSPECASYSSLPHNRYRCCSRIFCEVARHYAQSKSITLAETGNPDLPFMSPIGCTVAPYLRPICAIHTCQWTGSAKPHCGDAATTARYTELYRQAFQSDDGWLKIFETLRDSGKWNGN